MTQKAEPKDFMEGFVDDTGAFAVDESLAEDEEKESDDDDEPYADKPSRAGKKRERYDEMAARAGKADELEREVAELRGQVQAWAPMMGQRAREIAPPVDPELQHVETELERLSREQESIMRQYSAAPPAQQAELQKQYRALEDQRGERIADKALLKRRPSQQQVSQAETRRQFEARYPDIVGNEKAFNYAAGTFQRMRATDPNFVDSWETFDKIAEETRTTMGMKGYKASEATRRRYGGRPTGGSGGGGEAEPAVLLGHERKLARAKYPDDPPEKAYAKYYKNIKKG